MRSAATSAMSSDIRNGRTEVSLYGSNTSAYSSTADSRAARPVRSASRSGSSPTSGSQLPAGITSLLAPSCAPASRIWDTSSSSSGTVSSPPLCASASTPSMKFFTFTATWSASGRHSPPGVGGSDIKQSPSLEGAPQRHLIGVLQVAPDRQSARGPGHPQAHWLYQPSEKGRRSLAFEVGIGGEYQLCHRSVSKPRHQLPDPQLFRADPVDRADRSAEHVIAAAELADLLHRRDVLGLFHDADHRLVAPRVQADPALVGFGHVAARPAEPHPLGHLDQRVGEPPDLGVIGGQQVKRDPLGALGTDARQPPQLVDEVLDDAFVHAGSYVSGLPSSSGSWRRGGCGLCGACGPGPPMPRLDRSRPPGRSRPPPGMPGMPPPCMAAANGPICCCCRSSAAR